VVANHPETDFLGLHFGNNPEDIRWVTRVMERFPNFWLDTGARVGEIGRHNPAELRAVFLRFQDRVLFGTDAAYEDDHLTLGVPEPRSKTIEGSREFFRRHWEFFETDHRNIEHPSPIQGNWKVNAINLPPEVLRKLYAENARRLIPALR
jgi:predicted TIM-barrel fold metal-dependent hydrolase